MPKIIPGTFVLKAKLKGLGQVVYCEGIASNNHVLWTPDIDRAVKLSGLTEADLDSYVSNIWRHNDHYNTLGVDYAVSFMLFNIDKPPCYYQSWLGQVRGDSTLIAVADTPTNVARSIAQHAKKNYPRDRYFLYKHRTKELPEGYYPMEYKVIDKTTGNFLPIFYFIKEVPIQ